MNFNGAYGSVCIFKVAIRDALLRFIISRGLKMGRIKHQMNIFKSIPNDLADDHHHSLFGLGEIQTNLRIMALIVIFSS